MNASFILALLFLGYPVVQSAETEPLANPIRPRVIGGRVAQRNRYPYAQITLQDWRGHACGGSLIAPDIIMSAAHCSDATTGVYVGVFNVSDLSNGNVRELEVEEIVIHEEYDDETQAFDVMLLKLNEMVNGIVPLRINDDPNALSSGDPLTTLGWGAIQVLEDREVFPDLLHDVDLEYIPNQICRRISDEDGVALGRWLFDDMLCAGGSEYIGAINERDACFGDSGGPLLRLGNNPSEDVCVGIVSWGLDCGSIHPGVYHRSSSSYQWVRQWVCSLSDAPPDSFRCNTQAPTASPTTRPTAQPTTQPTTSPTSFAARQDPDVSTNEILISSSFSLAMSLSLLLITIIPALLLVL